MRLFLIVSCIVIFQCAQAQKHDSLKYENGYLHFHEYGKGEPVILLTGGPGAGYVQLEPVAKFISKTHRAILLEQRGTGRSRPTPYDSSTINMRTALGDINRIIDHLKLGQAHLLGHSWGAMLSMHFVANFPSRAKSLILLSSGPFKLDQSVFETYSANREARLSLDEGKRKNELLQKMQANTISPAEQKEYYKLELLPVLFDRHTADSLSEVINKADLNPKTGSFLFGSLFNSKTDLTVELKKFKKPIQIICGRQDPGGFISYEMKMLLPEANLYWINRCGHFPMYERPEDFYSILGTALR
jgi:proline iminopeptidase